MRTLTQDVRTLTVGVIGHVDHGKTVLVRALTGTETDRLAEERRRGISIVLGFAHLEVPGRGVLDLVDVPGHERFVRAMVAGATGIGAVLLVVAANEGARPQTLEHLAIARLLGVRRGVVAVTKARGMGELRAALADLLASTPEPEDEGFFHLPVDRAFAAAGFGAVVTGTLRRGAIGVGDEVELLPAGLRARVRGLQVHGLPVERAGPGQRVAVNLRGLKAADLSPGWSLATPGMVARARWLDVELRLLPDARPLACGDQVRLLLGTTEAVARLRLLDRAGLAPGE
ncbi:MAG: translation elongation factor, partial [Gemmatimonadetes bacterium]|nr:translation elongation factor [Gemmatimonadota bacterium]